MKIYRCIKCEQLYFTKASKTIKTCCKEQLIKLEPQVFDTTEHKAKITHIGNLLSINIDFPITDIFYLKFIAIKTNLGYQYKDLTLNKQIEVDFFLLNDEVLEGIYLYSNIEQLFVIKQ